MTSTLKKLCKDKLLRTEYSNTQFQFDPSFTKLQALTIEDLMDTARPKKRGNSGDDDDTDYTQDATSRIYSLMGAKQQQQLQGKNKQIGSPASSTESPSFQAESVPGYEHKQGERSKEDNVRASDVRHAAGNEAKKAGAKTTGEDEEDTTKEQSVDDSEDPDGPEGPLLRHKGLDEIKEALACIPSQERKSYKKAVKRVPSLVATESNPIFFLRCENFNASAAAKRLIKYWDFRCEIFGDRAFFPMVQTGTGALSRDDMVVLKTGSVVILPNHESGQVVLYLDRTKLLDFSKRSLESMMRCMFYVLSVVSEIVKAQTDGFLMLGVVVTPRCSDPMEIELARKSTALLKEVMPARMGTNHLLVCPSKSREGDLLQTLIATTVSVVQENFIFHFDGDSRNILNDMLRHGFIEGDLPPTFGGTWKFTKFAEWQKPRRRYEHERLTSQSSESNEVTVSTKSPPASLHGAEKMERKRKLNAIHSRHKRERRQAEFEDLEDERREVERERVALNQEAERLEGLISSAQQQVAIFESKARNESTGQPFAATASHASAAANEVDPLNVDVNRLVRDTLKRYTESTSPSHLTKLKDPP